MPSTDVMAMPSPTGNINQYRALVESFPPLGEEEERDLATRLQAQDDLQAAWRLVTANLRYVVYIAKGYKGYGLPQEDLIQEGNLGLMKAVQRFDPRRGVRLMAYATYWIRAHIHEFILKNWRIVKLATTKAKRKLFYKLRGAKQRLAWLKQHEANEIAQALDVSAEDVLEMESGLYAADESFEAPLGDEDGWAPAAYLQDQRLEPASVVAEHEFLDLASNALEEALDLLDPRSRDILESRWLREEEDKATLQELGDRYGVSAERIRQLEAAAIERLRKAIVPRLSAA